MITKTNKIGGQLEASAISGLIAGDLACFQHVYQFYFRRVFGFVNKFALNSEDAEEITQDVFLKLWDKKSEICEDKCLSSFLFTIAQNMVIDKFRQYAVREKHFSQLIGKDFQLNATEQLVNFYELSAIVNNLVDGLPARRRSIFKLSRERGLTNKEIADVLKISEGTVEKQMSKALAYMRSRLKATYNMSIEV